MVPVLMLYYEHDEDPELRENLEGTTRVLAVPGRNTNAALVE